MPELTTLWKRNGFGIVSVRLGKGGKGSVSFRSRHQTNQNARLTKSFVILGIGHDRIPTVWLTMGYVAAVTSGLGQLREDRGQATIERRRETSPGQPRQEGRLPNRGLELKILRWSQTTEYKAKRSRYPLLPSYEKEEKIEIEDETAKAVVEVTPGIHDTVTSFDTTTFLRGGYTRDPESLDDNDDQRNASNWSHGIDHTGFVGGSTPPILELGIA
ncbi:hypothetical protein WN51_12875 [Melipona quadrifasciata]|uniref:Uncharacterized protein n=1 Tax=Melipona quadrifasciata TaxID=166423 RepID=A0A0M9A501_9HYME|nr:hypothetical protein WN51_12875 [Melipona quadrifasciata]